MDQSFYTSGFLYSLKTHQILLHRLEQEDNNHPSWSLLGGEGVEGEDTQIAFQRIMQELLNLNLKPKDIYPIYDYYHEVHDKVNYVFYAEVKNPQEFECQHNGVYSWVAFNEVPKLLFTTHTEQDVIVGERVINLMLRLSQESQVEL